MKRSFHRQTGIAAGLVCMGILGGFAIGRTQLPPGGYSNGRVGALPIVVDSWVPTAVGPINQNMYGAVVPNIQPVASLPDYQNASEPTMLPRTDDLILMRRTAPGQVQIEWKGEPRAVRRIVFATLDKNRKFIDRKEIHAMPAVGTLKRTAKTVFAGIYIEYLNGAATAVIALVPTNTK